MTKQTKTPFDFSTDHFLFENGNVRAFERRLCLVQLNQDGIPFRGVDHLTKTQQLNLVLKGERLVRALVLVPIQPVAKNPV